MNDPLSDVIRLLRPRAALSRPISAAGPWAVRFSEFRLPSFCTLLEGGCRLTVDGQAPLTLQAGDFVLLPATPGFVLSGFEPADPLPLDPGVAAAHSGELRYGTPGLDADMRMLGGHFEFDSPDTALLVSLLPAVVHVRGAERLSRLVQLVGEESDSQRPGRDLVLARLVEVMLVEALRSTPAEAAPGLLRGLADARLARAIQQLHADPSRPWTVPQLAKQAALSRSVFFERFRRVVGLAPMEYVLAWRMAIARDLLGHKHMAIAEVAERVGYGSASSFSTAFSRHVGQTPGRYARSTRQD